MKKRKVQNNIVPYRQKRRINFVFIVFLMVFIYMAVQIYRMLTHESIRIFTVDTPTQTSAYHNYRGVITRDEEIVLTQQDGHVNYYVREGKKVGVETLVYSLDKDGSFSQALAQTYTDAGSLSNEMIESIKSLLNQTSKDGTEYAKAYDDKEALAAAVTDSFLFTAMEELSEYQNISGVATDSSGYILYSTDNLEGLVPEAVNLDTFQEENLKTQVYASGTRRAAGTFAYKLVKDDSFFIIFQMNDEDYRQYQNNSYLSIELTSIGATVNAQLSFITSPDGLTLASLKLNKYGSQFLKDRYIDFKIVQNPVKGYKIPTTALTTKDFFVIPKELIVKDSKTGAGSVYREISGQEEEISVSIYNETDTQYYIYSSSLEVGDYLIDKESGSRYLLSTMAPLDGVYNINRGYCIFRQVVILEETSDKNYYIVQNGIKFSISINDRIVLNADLVEENQIIY